MTPLKVSLAFVMSCWAAFAIVFVFLRPKVGKVRVTRRDPAAFWGFLLQAIGYAIAFSVKRSVFRPPVRTPVFIELAIALIAPMLAVLSVATVYWAVRVLGKQWHYVARIVEGHRLIREGPYAYVRNPIYSAMFGMLIATGLIVTNWLALIAAVAIFYIGTRIRVTREESLLRAEFGKELDEYVRSVPALIPRLKA
jgi:protein-S-isoprenylcysteine O-methyltransferase Ste14